MSSRTRFARGGTGRRDRLASPRLNTPVDLGALVAAAVGLHVIAFTIYGLTVGWGILPPDAPPSAPVVARLPAHGGADSWDVFEGSQDLATGTSPKRVADEVLTDNVLPFEESFGDDGLSDAPFRGPANNGLISLGGGAGGTFGGRRGRMADAPAGFAVLEGGERTWRRSGLVPHSTRVLVGDREELKLEGMNVSVHVEGFRARVLLDCLYRNDRDRALEGRFQVRLPNEASPYYFAFGRTVRVARFRAGAPKEGFAFGLDAIRSAQRGEWTEPREARMVPRARAARAYQETSRRRVDPALLEWGGPDVFSARVSPLAAGSLHRIVLGYEVDLASEASAWSYALDLPESIPDLTVDLHVADPEAVVTPGGPAVGGWYRYWHPVERHFAVRVPHTGAVMLRGRDEGVGNLFAVRFRPRLPVERATSAPRAVFLVDTSASANPVHFNVWLSLLAAVLERNRPALEEFAVAFFDVDAEWWQPGFVANTPANVAAVLEAARGRVLEGATDLRAALRAASARPGAYDVFLLSDGAVTWGEDDQRALCAALGTTRALFAYQTGLSGTDGARLQALAEATRGAVFSVASEAEVARAATAHTMRPWRILGVSIPGGRDLLLAGRPRLVYPGQELLLVGRGRPEADAEVTLAVSRGHLPRLLRTEIPSVHESELAPRIYGQVAVGLLEMVDAVPTETARAYATHFRVVGETCSLLMLESDADYRRFGITERGDAAFVRSHGASAAVAAALATGRDPGPKVRFLDLFLTSAAEGGVGATLPSRVGELLADLPETAFDVDSEALERRRVTPAPESASYREQLAKLEPDYDVVWRHAESLASSGDRAAALRSLSTLVERSPGVPSVLRDVGFQAEAWGYAGHAYHLLRRAADLRPHEMQGLADTAACLAAADRNDAAILWYEAALSRPGGSPTRDARRGTLIAYADLLDGIVAGRRRAVLSDYAAKHLPMVRHELGMTSADLVVTIGWNTDRTDVDLHVVEPGGEECFYGHPATRIGGTLTQDVTTGFGPESYVLRNAPPGPYQVLVRYYAGDNLRTSTRTRVWVTVRRGWGRADTTTSRSSVLLEGRGEGVPVAWITVEEEH